MARISELHYSNAYAASSGVSEFLEVALGAGEDPADFVVSFYHADGSVGAEIGLDDPGVQVSVDPDNGETVYVISADFFNIRLTDPDGGASNNYEAFALTNTDTGTVEDFYDIGGGTQNILALDGAAAGAVSENIPVLTGPQSTTTLQFNQPDPDTLTYETVAPGDTGIACFTAGTLVRTPDGARPIEDLLPGDKVLTCDHGFQTLRWIGTRSVAGNGDLAPIRITRGTLGAKQDILVSPQHRVLISGWQSEMFFGEREVLVPAKALVNGRSVQVCPQPRVTYVHMLFDRHELIKTHGLISESFYVSARSLSGVGCDAAAEILRLFPELRPDPSRFGPTAWPVRTPREASLLAVA